MTKKAKDTLAIAALVEQNPNLARVLKQHGHKVGETYVAPKAIASLALLTSLSEKGIDFDYVIGVFKRCFEAKNYVHKKTGLHSEEIVPVEDHKTQLKAVEAFTKLMNLNKGVDTADLQLDIPVSKNRIKVTFAGQNSKSTSQGGGEEGGEGEEGKGEGEEERASAVHEGRLLSPSIPL